MKYLVKILFEFLLLVATVNAQLFYISNKQFQYPEIYRRAGISANFKVQFDIEGFAPQYIRITSLDNPFTTYNDAIKQAIESNLKDLVYLQDSSNVTLIVCFSVKHYTRLSASYSEIFYDTLYFVMRSPIIPIDVDEAYRPPDPQIDTVLIEATVQYKAGKPRQSNILI